MVGSLFEAIVAWIILGNNLHGHRICPNLTWRAFAATTALPVFISWSMVLGFIPESPRWLLRTGKAVEAKEVLERLGLYDDDDDDTEFVY